MDQKEDLGKLSMEEAYDRLEALLDEMENGKHTLEETFALYTQGLELVRSCTEKIGNIEARMKVLENAAEQGEQK